MPSIGFVTNSLIQKASNYNRIPQYEERYLTEYLFIDIIFDGIIIEYICIHIT